MKKRTRAEAERIETNAIHDHQKWLLGRAPKYNKAKVKKIVKSPLQKILF